MRWFLTPGENEIMLNKQTMFSLEEEMKITDLRTFVVGNPWKN